MVLTPAAAAKLDEIRNACGMTITEVFRYSLMLMNIYVEAMKNGKQMRLVSKTDAHEIQVVEIPMFFKDEGNG